MSKKIIRRIHSSRGEDSEGRSVSSNILRGSVVIVLVSVLAKLTAFLSETILAAYLGTNETSDAYYMVSSVQQVIYPMLSVGIWKVFLPVYKEQITCGRLEEAKTLTNKVITLFTLVSVAAVALMLLFTGPLVSLVAPGFTGTRRELCMELVRISSPMYVFILASAVYAAILQCHNKFFGSQIREVASHIPTIVAALFFYRSFGVRAMAVALVVGGAFRLLIELPFVDWGYRFKPKFSFHSHDFGLIVRRLPSALVSEGVTQLNSLVDKMMASTLPNGTISALNYGHRLVNVFSGLLSTAVSTALYPQMIELIAQKKSEALSRLLTRIMNLFCVLMVPITVACMLFRQELVSAVYQRGSFDEYSTGITSGIFALYILGIYFIACNTVVSDLFYGHGDTKTPMFFCIFHLGANVILNLVFIHLWGVNGLALATSVSAVLSYALRLYFARRFITVQVRAMAKTAFKVLLASAFACGLPRLLFTVIHVNKYLTLLFSALMGFGIYLVGMKLLGITELKDLEELLRRKLHKSR